VKSDNTQGDAILVRLLRQLVAMWPKAGTKNVDAAFSQLREHLAVGFDDIDFENRVESVSAVKKIETSSQGAVLYFCDADKSLQRAIFVRSGPEGWELESLKFQCPVCFGTGGNDGAKCTMCGGGGWGAG
jgi:hypothetical protein